MGLETLKLLQETDYEVYVLNWGKKTYWVDESGLSEFERVKSEKVIHLKADREDRHEFWRVIKEQS